MKKHILLIMEIFTMEDLAQKMNMQMNIICLMNTDCQLKNKNMLLNKVKEKGIDLYILIKDDMKNLYIPHPFMFHANYDSFQLIFKFEDWSGIIGDGEEHIQTIAEYINADNMVKEWNDKHKINEAA